MVCTPGYEPQCRGARLPPCTCQCGGANHGAEHGGIAVLADTPIRRRRIRRARRVYMKLFNGFGGSLGKETIKKVRSRRVTYTKLERRVVVGEQLGLLEQVPADERVSLFECPDKEEGWKKKRGVKLLTAGLLAKLPPIGGQEKAGDEAIVWVKWFTPDSSWSFYLTEYDPETGQCFGLVDGFEKELGYFSLPEIMEVRGPRGLAVERDKFWKPVPLREVMNGWK